jgi:hypothetical protein
MPDPAEVVSYRISIFDDESGDVVTQTCDGRQLDKLISILLAMRAGLEPVELDVHGSC